MTDEEQRPTAQEAGDARRAAALIAHRASASPDDIHIGVRTVIEETVARGRIMQLLKQLYLSYQSLIDVLRMPFAHEMIDQCVDELAEQSTDLFTRRAVTTIGALRAGDRERLAAVLAEVTAEPGGDRKLVGAVSDVYMFVLPELASSKGRNMMSDWLRQVMKYDTDDQ